MISAIIWTDADILVSCPHITQQTSLERLAIEEARGWSFFHVHLLAMLCHMPVMYIPKCQWKLSCLEELWIVLNVITVEVPGSGPHTQCTDGHVALCRASRSGCEILCQKPREKLLCLTNVNNYTRNPEATIGNEDEFKVPIYYTAFINLL